MDSNAQLRLASTLSVIEREMEALSDLHDGRLVDVLQTMSRLRAEIVAALASLEPALRHGSI